MSVFITGAGLRRAPVSPRQRRGRASRFMRGALTSAGGGRVTTEADEGFDGGLPGSVEIGGTAPGAPFTGDSIG